MGKERFRVLKADWLLGAALVAGVLGMASSAWSQDECLDEFRTKTGDVVTTVADQGQACGNAVDKKCAFQVQLCLNVDKPDNCTTGTFKKKKIKAKGHCGPVAKISAIPSGTSSVCGAFAGITVRTKKKGKKEGVCKIMIRGAKTTDKRKDNEDIRLVCKPDTDPCPTTTTTRPASTTTTASTSTTTTTGAPCPTGCAAAQIDTTTGAGELAVATLPAFPFPAGVQTRINIGPAGNGCRHDAIVPTGGFTVPVFCSVAALGLSTTVTAQGCEAGGSDGNGFVWDGNSTCPDADVSTRGDTSDGTCNPPAQPCDSTATGAGNNTLGDIDTVLGNNSCDPTGVHTQLAIPVRSFSWSDGDASQDCPDEDGQYDESEDLFVSDFSFILRPTTATATASYVDKNADGCSRSGAGPDHTKVCSNDNTKPCGASADCGSGNTCVDGDLHGTPPAGPCCVAGQTSTVVATGVAFSGGAPLYDLIFGNKSPTTIDACNAPVTLGSCTLTTSACAQ